MGQTLAHVPDPKLIKLYVNDEPLLLSEADCEEYSRRLDFRTGTLERNLVWRTPSGVRVRVRSTRQVSFTERHLALMTFEVTMLDGVAPVTISSQLLNRQDGEDEYHVAQAALGEGDDPRQAHALDHRVLLPRLSKVRGIRAYLGYRCAHSEMTLACAVEHQVESDCDARVDTEADDDRSKTIIHTRMSPGQTLKVTKFAAFHPSRGVPADELADRCARTLDRSIERGALGLADDQRDWLDDFWARSDVDVTGRPRTQPRRAPFPSDPPGAGSGARCHAVVHPEICTDTEISGTVPIQKPRPGQEPSWTATDHSPNAPSPPGGTTSPSAPSPTRRCCRGVSRIASPSPGVLRCERCDRRPWVEIRRSDLVTGRQPEVHRGRATGRGTELPGNVVAPLRRAAVESVRSEAAELADRRGQRDRTRRALEQLGADAFLQRLDAVADCRSRLVQQVGGGGEAAQLRHRDEGSQGFLVEPGPVQVCHFVIGRSPMRQAPWSAGADVDDVHR